jgi:hypothetical protein
MARCCPRDTKLVVDLREVCIALLCVGIDSEELDCH